MRQGYYEEPAEPVAAGSTFSHGKTILVIAIVVGCFAVLWPKIFYPMLFGSQMDRQEDTVAANPRQFPGGGAGPGPSPGGAPGSEFLHPAMRERGKMAGMAGMPEVGARPPIRTVDKEWGGRGGPMPGMRPTMGGPGIQAQQPRGSGTMGVLMPIYTVGIIIFFVYTTMKILFKNKDNEEEEDEYTQKRKRELKYRQEEEAEYARYTQNFNKLQQKRPQEVIEKDPKQHILEKEVASPHTRIEEINQIVNDLKQETIKKSQEAIPMDCTKTFLDPDTIKYTSPDPDTKTNEASHLEIIKSTPTVPDTLKDMPSDQQNEENEEKDEKEEIAVAQKEDGNEPSEAELRKEKDQNKSGIIIQKTGSEIKEKEASVDPRDLEINLLKKRLEETEKAMERIMAQMGTVTQQLLPQNLEATLLSHPAIQTNFVTESSPHETNHLEEKKELHSTNQQNMENDIPESDEDDESKNEKHVKDTDKEQDSQ